MEKAMVVRVNLTVDLLFQFELNGPDEDGHDQSRIDAANFAEENVIGDLLSAASKIGTVVDSSIVQVHEAEDS